ncbi:MAG: hypothetical protein R3F49_11690 [Planctomycetota bacterium]
MSGKKRLLRAGCITLVLLGLVGYFGFSTLLFPPFEGRFKPTIAGIVPRSVDFFVSRTDLASAFSKFPQLKVVDELKGHPGFEAFLDSPTWADFKRANGVDEGLAQLDAALKQIPLGLDPLGIFGGKELAIAGNFVGVGVDHTDWAVYGRVSRAGKLAVAALRYPGLLKLEQQGLKVEQEGDVFTLSGSSFKRPISVSRVRDIVVAGTSAALVKEAVTLSDTGSQDSLLLAAPYGEHVIGLPGRDPKRRDFELVLDVRSLREKWGMVKPWPDAKSQSFGEALAGRLFQIGATNRVFGIVNFEAGVAVDLFGEFSSELITAPQERIYRARSFDHAALDAVARAAHEDTTFFAYMHGPIATLLDMVVQSMEPALRENLLDVLRETGRYKTLDEVIKDLDDGLHDRLAIMARPNDWDYERDYRRKPGTNELEYDEDGKPIYDGPPFTREDVFAWTLVTWHENEKKLIDLRELIGQKSQKFGLRGRTPKESGYFVNKIAGNFETREFWSPFIPGTGHIATVNLPEQMMVTNRYTMLEDLTQNIMQRASRTGRLTDRSDFAALLDEMPGSGNIFLWVNPKSGVEILGRQMRAGARSRIESSIDLVQKRRELEVAARRDVVGGKPRNQLTTDEVARLDTELDARVAEYRDQTVQANLPGALAQVDRDLAYMSSISAGMACLNLEEKSFRLAVRVLTPLTAR